MIEITISGRNYHNVKPQFKAMLKELKFGWTGTLEEPSWSSEQGTITARFIRNEENTFTKECQFKIEVQEEDIEKEIASLLIEAGAEVVGEAPTKAKEKQIAQKKEDLAPELFVVLRWLKGVSMPQGTMELRKEVVFKLSMSWRVGSPSEIDAAITKAIKKKYLSYNKKTDVLTFNIDPDKYIGQNLLCTALQKIDKDTGKISDRMAPNENAIARKPQVNIMDPDQLKEPKPKKVGKRKELEEYVSQIQFAPGYFESLNTSKNSKANMKGPKRSGGGKK